MFQRVSCFLEQALVGFLVKLSAAFRLSGDSGFNFSDPPSPGLIQPFIDILAALWFEVQQQLQQQHQQQCCLSVCLSVCAYISVYVGMCVYALITI